MMQGIVNQIYKLLFKNQKTIAVAESCTGGLLSNLLSRLSGSSRYFILGVVVYSNKSKNTILSVPSKIIEQKGAVSRAVAKIMAESVRKLAGTDFGIGITGIAGPTGGTRQKPVGTVFIAISSKTKNLCKKFRFRGNRSAIRRKAAWKALELLKEFFST